MRKLLLITLIVLFVAGGCASPRQAANLDPVPRCAQDIAPTPGAVRDGSNAEEAPESRVLGTPSADWVARRVDAAIVRVRSEVDGGPDEDTPNSDRVRATTTRLGGTGVVIASDGIVLTNEHVVRNATSVTITMANGMTHEVRRIMRAPKLDLAVLWIGVPTDVALSPAEEIADPGVTVVAVSAARRDKPRTVRSGIVTRRTVSLQNELDASRTRYYDDLIESTAKLEPGFSGGPLLDMNGHLLGINVAALGKPDDDHALAYAIPLHRANRRVIDNLIAQLRR